MLATDDAAQMFTDFSYTACCSFCFCSFASPDKHSAGDGVMRLQWGMHQLAQLSFLRPTCCPIHLSEPSIAPFRVCAFLSANE